MLTGLAWIGARARWILAIGVVVAPFLPAVGSMLRPFLPALVVLSFSLAVARIDPAPILSGFLRPRRLLVLVTWLTALMVATPVLLWAAALVLGLPAGHVAALVYTGAAPPITSAAGLCLMLGLNAAFALELTVIASLLMPVIGPLVAIALLGDAVPIEAFALGQRLAVMIVLGIAAGITLRRLIGAGRLASHATAFDGAVTLAMLTFIIPLFDGMLALAAADPGAAAGLFALAIAANLGVQAVVAALLRRFVAGAKAGAAGLMWGNRTVAFYLAALPPDPVYQLYVALYQIPMLLTPLVMGRWLPGHPPRPQEPAPPPR